MNRKSVIIKSNKYGLTVILDDKMPFQELLLDIADKFQESANFFQKCKNGCDIPWKSTEPGRRTAGDRDDRRSLRHPYPLCGG